MPVLPLLNSNDQIFVAGASGMAGGAIVRSLERAGYGQSARNGALLTPSRTDLNLLDARAVHNWFETYKPTVVVLAAANRWRNPSQHHSACRFLAAKSSDSVQRHRSSLAAWGETTVVFGK